MLYLLVQFISLSLTLFFHITQMIFNNPLTKGLDEGIHTMRMGGKRRMIIPSSMSYTDFGMGPLPVDPQRRRKLGKSLNRNPFVYGHTKGNITLCISSRIMSDIWMTFKN